MLSRARAAIRTFTACDPLAARMAAKISNVIILVHTTFFEPWLAHTEMAMETV